MSTADRPKMMGDNISRNKKYKLLKKRKKMCNSAAVTVKLLAYVSTCISHDHYHYLAVFTCVIVVIHVLYLYVSSLGS